MKKSILYLFTVLMISSLVMACGESASEIDGDTDMNEAEEEVVDVDGDVELEAEESSDGDIDDDVVENEATVEQEMELEEESVEEEIELTYCYEDPCTYHANCKDTATGAECECVPGYRGDGFLSCEDINECEEGTDTCDPMTGCENNPGGFNCGVCPEDYTGNASAGCIPVTAEHFRDFTIGSSTNIISVYSNYPFDLESEAVTEIMVFIPEKGVDVEQYYLAAYDLVRKARATARTFLIVPIFKTSADSHSASEIFWGSENDWILGNQTPAGTPMDISSFKIVDNFISSLISSKLPNINGAIVVGHKTAADFVQRYAATNKLSESLSIGLRYVVSSANSYMYVSNERKIGDGFSSTVTDCTDYNDYPYGSLGLNEYAALAGTSYISTKYPVKDVHYIIGSLDTASDETDFDSSCSALLQGANRLERAQIFKEYMNYYGGSEIHNLIEVAEIGGDLNGLFGNQSVKDIAFNVWVE